MSDDDDDIGETDQDLLEKVIKILARSFDAVTIFVSRFEADEDGGNTITGWRGVGNWNTRYGQISEWLVKKNAEFVVEARRDWADDQE